MNQIWIPWPISSRRNVLQQNIRKHIFRPLSVPFLFRSSGKETDTATMLRLEKYGRIEFTPGKWTTTGQNALKWMSAYARVSGTFDRFNFRTFFRLWQLVLWMSYSNLLQGVLNVYRKYPFSWHLSLNDVIFCTATTCRKAMLGIIWCFVISCYKTLSKRGLAVCSSSAKYNII